MMKIKRLLALMMAALLALTMGACKNEKEPAEPSSSEPEEIVDPNYPVAIGDIRVGERPETVVSLSPAATELLAALGADDRLEGVGDYCDYPPEIEHLTRCGSPATPNLDSIKKLRPQVVFSSAPLSQADTVAIQQLGAEVVVLPRADSMDELEENYRTAALVLDGLIDGEENGRELCDELFGRYEALRHAADGIADRWHGVWLRMAPLTMATGETFEGELMTGALGVDNDAKEYDGWLYPQDKAVNLYPEVIFYDQSIDPEYFKGTPVYSTTDAYKQNRMYPFDALAFERQSPRMFDELEEMFSAVYPDVEVEPVRRGGADEPEGESAPEDDGEMLDLDDATQIKE